MRIPGTDTAAIAIDYQERLMPAIGDNAAVIRNSRILLAGLALLQVPLIVSRQYPRGLGDTIPEIREVAANGTTLDKTAFSCFDEPEIRRQVERFGRANLVLCGVESHVCVLQTAVDLHDAGYRVVVVADCTGSRKANDKTLAMRRLTAEGIVPVSYEQILFELLRGASAPAFRDISNLVR